MVLFFFVLYIQIKAISSYSAIYFFAKSVKKLLNLMFFQFVPYGLTMRGDHFGSYSVY